MIVLPSGLRRISAISLLTVLGLMLFVGAASAHAQLIRSDPADGILLASAPEKVVLTFSEPVRPLVARLIQPDGRTAILKTGDGRGADIALPLPRSLGDGTYILSWRVVSSDGHPIGGGLVFSVGTASTGVRAVVEPSNPLTRFGLWLSRLVLMLGLIVGVGGLNFQILVGRYDSKADRRIVSEALLAGLLAVPPLLGFQGLDSLDAPISDLLTAHVWRAGLQATSYGGSVLMATTALLLASSAQWAGGGSRSRLLLSVFSLLLVGVASASAGHASTAPPQSITRPAVFLHMIAVMLWMGSLIPLVAILILDRAAAPKVLRRFSSAIPAIIGILGISGIVLAAVQVRTIPALWTTDYGIVLLTKVALVAAILVLAAINRYRLTAPVLADDRAATRQLIRTTSAEIILGSIVIAVLGLWRFTPPPRVMLAVPGRAGLQQIQVRSEDVSATLSIRPPRVGPVSVEIRDLRIGGTAAEPLGIKVELGKPSYGIGPFVREARRQDGAYLSEGFVLPLDGFWVVRVTILVSEFRSVTLTDVFDVAKAAP